MDPFDIYRNRVQTYLEKHRNAKGPLPLTPGFQVVPLARGEYNLNYLVTNQPTRLVFRVNLASQIDREDQIVYEYKALRLLQASGVTPIPYFVDDSRTSIDRGISVMEYLPGRPLDYTRNSENAARVFATIHQLEVDPEQNHLIVEEKPLSLIHTECMGLLRTYFNSDLADPAIASYLSEVADWADRNRRSEEYFRQNPYNVIVNTEVNSGNFIVNNHRKSTHLIDWEMPRWGDPSSDLCHFLSPLTTLWKTDFRFREKQERDFLNAYLARTADAHLHDTLLERMRLKMPFVYLRGISWSAMGWISYQDGSTPIRNEDTWKTLQRYLRLDFIRSLFDPFIKG